MAGDVEGQRRCWRAVLGGLSPAVVANGVRIGGPLGGATAQRSASGRRERTRGSRPSLEDIDGSFQKRGRRGQQQADQRWSDASDERGAPWGPADDAGANMGKQKQQEDNCRRDDVDSR
jgi:hypothetical protein